MQSSYALRNPIADLIPDELYELLERNHVLSEKGVRDHEIRTRFRTLRDAHISAGDASDRIRDEHPYLQFDTIRKIVYRAG